MKLKEKILYCRKKAGLSQEALAERLGVSRQAISKWETGDAVPEINKLLLLANAFGVTTDWLLCDEEPEEEIAADPPADEAQPATKTTWVDSLPGVIGRLLRRYGWLFGVYLAAAGACFTGIGALARYLVSRMFSGSIFGTTGSGFPSDTIYFDQYGTQMNSTFSNMATNNPVSIMGTVIMVVGIIMLISGIIIAVVLKKRSKE
ncbi:helix-turn-helix domain-containing protein [uncultured Oscillibacter sp.]|uniref:helix-turn-helix domain-containing protein n=1 Tax=uncultured Oscillibacter sp. TaxID=876091 RepID=UPI0025F0B11B|nr:helix-turn-helix transcriptional regulator [uncultured Oscillibacter sp.]